MVYLGLGIILCCIVYHQVTFPHGLHLIKHPIMCYSEMHVLFNGVVRLVTGCCSNASMADWCVANSTNHSRYSVHVFTLWAGYTDSLIYIRLILFSNLYNCFPWLSSNRCSFCTTTNLYTALNDISPFAISPQNSHYTTFSPIHKSSPQTAMIGTCLHVLPWPSSHYISSGCSGICITTILSGYSRTLSSFYPLLIWLEISAWYPTQWWIPIYLSWGLIHVDEHLLFCTMIVYWCRRRLFAL